MRFLAARQSNRSLPHLLLFFYGYFLLHWVTGVLMFQHKLGFSYASIVRYYRGDTELFMLPRSFIGLLEVSHFHLFAMGMFFIVFSHLLLQTHYSLVFKNVINRMLAMSLFLDVLSGWFVRYVAAGFAWLKLGSFVVLQLVSLILLLGLIVESLTRRYSGVNHPASRAKCRSTGA